MPALVLSCSGHPPMACQATETARNTPEPEPHHDNQVAGRVLFPARILLVACRTLATIAPHNIAPTQLWPSTACQQLHIQIKLQLGVQAHFCHSYALICPA
jgi:hypothetical protein